MSKRNGSSPKTTEVLTEDRISSKGVPYILHGLPPLEVPDIYESVNMPTKPTYTVELAGGGTQTFDHDETTLVSDEDKATWQEYLDQVEIADSLLTERMLNAILIEGIEVEPQNIERWKKRRKMIGLPIPEDEDELLLAYKKSEVACSKEDITDIMTSVMRLTGVSEEAMNKALRSFPDTMEPES